MAIFKKKTPSAGSGQAEDKKTEKSASPKKESMKDLYTQGEAKKTTVKKSSVEKSDDKKASAKKEVIAYRTLVRPLITEKAANMGPENKYVFAVAPNANKVEIAKAIEEVYGIKPVSVNVINVGGKKVRQGRTIGKRKDWRKAVITMPKGKTINIYEGV